MAFGVEDLVVSVGLIVLASYLSGGLAVEVKSNSRTLNEFFFSFSSTLLGSKGQKMRLVIASRWAFTVSFVCSLAFGLAEAA